MLLLLLLSIVAMIHSRSARSRDSSACSGKPILQIMIMLLKIQKRMLEWLLLLLIVLLLLLLLPMMMMMQRIR